MRRMWIACKFALLYFRITVHASKIWHMPADVEDNDKFLQKMYPKEWKELEVLRNSYYSKEKP